MIKHFTQIDLFGLSVFLQNEDGKEILYTIESKDGITNICFVQKRKSSRARWSKKRLIESTKDHLKFEYSENETGFRLEKVI